VRITITADNRTVKRSIEAILKWESKGHQNPIITLYQKTQRETASRGSEKKTHLNKGHHPTKWELRSRITNMCDEGEGQNRMNTLQLRKEGDWKTRHKTDKDETYSRLITSLSETKLRVTKPAKKRHYRERGRSREPVSSLCREVRIYDIKKGLSPMDRARSSAWRRTKTKTEKTTDSVFLRSGHVSKPGQGPNLQASSAETKAKSATLGDRG